MRNEYQNYGGQGYYGDDGVDPGTLAALAAFGMFFLLLALALYAVNAIFLSKILKNAGHKNPVAASWVPVWNTAALMEVGGIKQPWIWTAIIFGGSVIGGSIPGIGPVFSLAAFVVSVIVTIWLARGLQNALRTGGTGGVVLAVLVPIAWVIWMGVVSGRERYDRRAALAQGDSMPMNWFGDADRNASFPGEPSEGQQNAGSYYQSGAPQSGYQAPQGGFQQSQGANSQYGAPVPRYEAPEPSQSGFVGYSAQDQPAPPVYRPAPEQYSEAAEPSTDSAFEGDQLGSSRPQSPRLPDVPPAPSAPIIPKPEDGNEGSADGNSS